MSSAREPDTPAPIAVDSADPRWPLRPSAYPPPFAARVAGRAKRPLGDLFGLTRFGVNITRIRPGSESALRHAHSAQDEFVYILSGHPVLITGAGETPLAPGMCAGFKAGSGDAHHLVNRTAEDVVFLEVGDRTEGDDVVYPDDDMAAHLAPDGRRAFTRKNGSPF